MRNPELEPISKRLDQLVMLGALSLIDGKKQKDQIALLSKTGFQPREIAGILGTTANTVSVALAQLRRGHSKPEARKGETQ